MNRAAWVNISFTARSPRPRGRCLPGNIAQDAPVDGDLSTVLTTKTQRHEVYGIFSHRLHGFPQIFIYAF